MPLESGHYYIRWAPLRVPEGLFATSDGINTQVAAKGLGPPPLQQIWSISPVDGGKPGTYSITLAQFAGPRGGWGLEGDLPIHVPVFLTENKIAEWLITEVDPENRIYRIIYPALIGVTRAVAEEDGRLFLNTYVVGESNLPQWQITQAPSDIVN